jgi:hypothetical protein
MGRSRRCLYTRVSPENGSRCILPTPTAGGGSIGNFRDVVAIDTVPVRPKDDRLAALFKSPSAAVEITR